MAANMMKYLFVLALLVSGEILAESLPDPTRPPPGIDGSSTAAAVSAYPKIRGLQSVIISPAHCAAIIDGKTVNMGAMHGKERLIEVTERGVVLQGEGGRRTLTLFPAVGIKQTVTLQQDKGVTKCNLEQNRQVKNPAKQAGQKEKK